MPLTITIPDVLEPGPGWAEELRAALAAIRDFANQLETELANGGGGGGPVPEGVVTLLGDWSGRIHVGTTYPVADVREGDLHFRERTQ